MHISVLLFLSNLFSGDMIIILLVVLVLFGGDKLPEIARGLGKGIRDFKEASDGIKREINDHINSLEEKKAEEALNKRAEEIRSSQTVDNDHLIENRPPVEGTMTYNENHVAGNSETTGENATEKHNGHAVSGENGIGHSEPANEPAKNS